MMLTLRNFAGMEIDLDWSGPRADIPPVLLLYDGRLFWRHAEKPGHYFEERVDDVSRYTVLARRQPDGHAERADIIPVAVENSPSTDDDDMPEID